MWAETTKWRWNRPTFRTSARSAQLLSTCTDSSRITFIQRTPSSTKTKEMRRIRTHLRHLPKNPRQVRLAFFGSSRSVFIHVDCLIAIFPLHGTLWDIENRTPSLQNVGVCIFWVDLTKVKSSLSSLQERKRLWKLTMKSRSFHNLPPRVLNLKASRRLRRRNRWVSSYDLFHKEERLKKV